MRGSASVTCAAALFAASVVFGAAEGTLSLGTVSGSCGGSIAVGLHLTPVDTSLTFLSVRMSWDPGLLSFDQVVEGARSQSLFAIEASAGSLRIEFFDFEGDPAVTGGPGSKLLDIVFTCAGPQPCGEVPVRIDQYDARSGTRSVGLLTADGAVDFGPCAYTLTTEVDPAGAGSVERSPDKSGYDDGEAVTLTAVPEIGYAFDHWSGEASGSSNPTTITIHGDTTVVAHFRKLPPTGLVISGEGEPCAGSSYQYTCTVSYANGSKPLDSCAVEWFVDGCGAASIDDCGLLTADPGGAGVSCTVSAAYNEDGVTVRDTLTITIADCRCPPETTVIDNGDPGTQATGTWKTSSGACPYGGGSLYSKTPGSTYSFEKDLSPECSYEVAVWSSEYSSRCTDVPIQVWDGDTLLRTIKIDQRNMPCRWNVLGTFTFASGTARVVILAQSSDCSTCADAVRFTTVGAAAQLESIEITGPAELCEGGSANYHVTARFSNATEMTVDTCSVQWSIDCTDRAEVSSCGVLTAEPGSAGSDCVLTASYTLGGVTREDQLVVSFIQCPCPEETVVIDNGDPGTFPQGSWKTSSGSCPYGAGSLYSRSPGSTYSYEYEAQPLCPYEISIWSSSYKSRCTSVPVQIWDGDTLLATLRIDQLNDPCRWIPLGTYTFTRGPARVVVIAETDQCSTCADAVRFSSAGPPPSLESIEISGQAQPCEGRAYQYTVTARYSNGGTEELDPCSVQWEISCTDVAEISSCGLLSSAPGSAGRTCTIRAAYTSGGVAFDAEAEITFQSCPCPLDTVVIDNGDPDTLPVGSWKTSGGSCPYGGGSLYSRSAGSSYQYSLDVAPGCRYKLSIWSSQYPSRCTAVPVQIWDGGDLLATVHIDQLNAPCRWNPLGTYTFRNGPARVVVIAETGDCSTCADAVKFEGAGPPPVLQSITLAGPAELCEGGTYSYQATAHYSDATSRTLDPCTCDWEINCPEAAQVSGCGEVQTAAGSAGTDCQLTVRYTEGAVTVEASLDFSIESCPCPEETFVLDNGDPGTEAIGEWKLSGGSCPYGDDSLYSKDVGARYVFTREVLEQCPYDLSIWSSQWPSRCTSVPVQVWDGDRLLATVSVDQNNDYCRWNPIGRYRFPSGLARVVVLAESSSCSTCADAVRFGRVQPGELTGIRVAGSEVVCEGEPTAYSVEAFYSDGTSQPLDPCTCDWSISCPGDITDCGVFTSGEGSAGGDCTIQATYSEGGVTVSDQLVCRIVECGACPEVIIDDGDQGTSSTGTWLPSSGACPYGPGSLYSKSPGSTYTFSLDAVGCAYAVYLRWTQWSSRCTSVPVSVYDGTTLLAEVLVNQRSDPCTWYPLGVYTFSGTARVVVTATSSSCSTSVDAVRFAGPTKSLYTSTSAGEGDIAAVYGSEPVVTFRRGDVNADGRLNAADAVSLAAYVFGNGPAPPCADAADVDDDGLLTASDLLVLLERMYGGQEAAGLGSGCEPDRTADSLSCARYETCE